MSRGRPRTFDADSALERAVLAFWRQGYTACSLHLLLEEMDLSRSSFYQTFGDKNRLFCNALERYCTRQADALVGRLKASESAWAFLEQCLYTIADGEPGQPPGCMLMNSASELGADSEPFGPVITAGLDRFAQVFRHAVERAMAEGSISPRVDADALADFLISCICGLRTLSKAGMDRQRLRAIAAAGLQGLRSQPGSPENPRSRNIH